MDRAAIGSRVHVYFLLVCLTVYCKGTAGTTYRPTTTPPTTIRPHGPDGWCNYEGIWYEDGENIETDKSGCSGIVCIGGEIANWDNWCALYSSTPSTTTPPPTTPTPPRTTIPAGSCFYNNAWHADGTVMYSCTNPLCCGTICSGGSPMAWDHKCSPALSPPPPCNGVYEYVDYQCCPICHGSNTTTPPTTTPQTTTPTTTTLPLPFCFQNGQLYNNYDVFDLDPNGCHGKECHYGDVRPWSKHCSFSEDSCDGTLVNVTGECCPICEVTVKTTLPSTESQSTSTPKSAPTTGKVCVIRGQTYALNMRTNSDECNKCYCTLRGEECHMTICGDVTDCVNTIRPKGECCFICSDANSVTQASLLLMTVLLIQVVI